jgi:hypothetical protein
MYIITVDQNGKVSQEKIDRLKRIHETPQDPVVVVFTDVSLPDGYTVGRFDGLVKHLIKSEPRYAENADVKRALHEQNERLSKVKFFNR